MRNYTAHDIKDMFDSYKQHVSHVIVAHTYHRPYVANTNVGRFKHVRADSYLKQKLVETSKDTRYALNCFNKLLYPNATNKVVRMPDLYKPLAFVTIEGATETTDRAQTIHVNIALRLWLMTKEIGLATRLKKHSNNLDARGIQTAFGM